MEEILYDLHKLQTEALDKGINFDIELTHNDQKKPVVTAKMQYSSTGPFSQGFVATTTFTESMKESVKATRMERLHYYISTVTGPIDLE